VQAITWEPTARVFVTQKFNIGEGTLLALDMYQSATNFTARHGIGLEEQHANHIYARYAQSNWMLHQATLEEKQVAGRRQKRNIFGSIISTLTGLATEEQLQTEQLREQELEKKVAKMLSHEIDAEKQLQILGDELNEYAREEEKLLKQVKWDIAQDNLYWSRKVGVPCHALS